MIKSIENINVVFVADTNQLVGVMAAMNSVIKNCCNYYKLRFYILVNSTSYTEYLQQTTCLFGKTNFEIRIIEFEPPTFLKENMRVNFNGSINNIMNFARFYLFEILPTLDKIIYLDADVIVQADIEELWLLAQLDQHIIACVPSGIGSYNYIGSFYRNAAQLAHIDSAESFFNAGVYVTSLQGWRDQNILCQVEYWMVAHKNEPKGLFELGTQPILNLIFYKDYEHLPPEWNVIGVGDKEYITLNYKNLEGAKILHWKGFNKPWLPNGYFKNFWNPYDLLKVNQNLD